MADLRVYVDTSAYLAVLLGEPNHPKKQIENKILCSSTLLVLESERGLIRLVRDGLLEESDYERAFAQLKGDIQAFIFRDLTLDLCLTSDFPPVKTPRSSDLAHLRTAKWFQQNGGLYKFVSVDKRQLGAAKDLGLPV